MEEVSSLDSYHTEGADSAVRPESETSKPDGQDDELGSNLYEKANVVETEKDVGTEESFDQISEGSFNLEDSSHATTSGKGHKSQIVSKFAKIDEADTTHQKSTEFEEVDANSSAHVMSVNIAEESDMLGESDMTLPHQTAHDESTEGEKSQSTMDVDNDDGGDVEMASSKATDKSNNNEDDVDPQKATSSEEGAESGANASIDSSKEGFGASESVEEHNEMEDEGTADEERDETLHRELDSNERNDSVEQPEDDDEENDERCENVQEPEESDICLIPDDTESQMTEEEKEQAILARENAEKEDAIAEAKKEKERAAEEAKENAADNDEDNIDHSSSETAAQVNTADADADADADEPSQEDAPNSEGGTGVVSKIIIGWIVSSVHKCKQCGETKTCDYRLKDPELTEPEYVCELACCENLLAAHPGRYFIRRKKFLVEEVPFENAQDLGETAEHSAQGIDEYAADAATAITGKRPARECLQCKETKECKFFFRQENECYYICNDDCFNLLNSADPEKFKLKRQSIRVRNIITSLPTDAAPLSKKATSAEARIVARTPEQAEAARLARAASFTRRCADCFAEIVLSDRNLLWETMDFCNAVCLGKYQRTVGSECQTCKGEVPHNALGKYCVRFGFDIRQFCCAGCLNEYKKGLKTCSCCQKDISSANEGFLAPVGDKEQFKDFCSQACMRRYDIMCNPKKKLRTDTCAVCNNEKPVRVEIVVDDKECIFCSNPCFSAFKFVSNIVADQCCMCCKYFERKGTESFTIYTERRAKVFCSRICMNVYIIVHRRIVSCQWCKVKKYNFDMIYKQQDAQEILMCSLNCLTLYGVSVSAFTRSVAKCDNCGNSATPQYHLTMSDASMRNFCTYQCVMQFQNQFARAPLTLENDPHTPLQTDKADENGPFPTGLPKRVKLKESQQSGPPMKLPNKNASMSKKGTLPVISTVSSLASGETETVIANARGRQKRSLEYTRSPSPASSSSVAAAGKRASSLTGDAGVQVETKIITVPPYPPAVRNVATSCRPQTSNVGVQHDPDTVTKEVQTEKDYSNKMLIPVPVPIYVPQPMYMYSAPFPVPVPIPLPIPVPIFIPTTRNSAQGILKEIKKIQDKMPADPFEAELLMMAEMVAEEKRDSDSDSDDEIKNEPGAVTIEYGNNVQQVEVTNNSYGEDVLQMALKMATGEYDQPTVDLESAMTVNTITNPPPGMMAHNESIGHMGMQQEQHIIDSQRAVRGRKRGSMNASPRNSRSPVKRSRLQDMDHHQEPVPEPIQTIEKPDANMCLKYTFGVNAWKQWVMTKNADIEKSSNPRRRSFKTELLQMTADELNYSLCLFVKEVRKPNGTEYAPDTIYYLVLGIQQYLYENGRIDNIFTDPYYERFTDCLDEVARKFSVLYNDSQYIVTRVEEEHLWECKQLGAHSPHVLLSTLMFFNTKHFNLTTVEEHMQLSFSHIMKHWKRSGQNTKTPGTRNVLLRFYPPQSGLDANPRKKKVYEQQENEENPLRCPVRLYEFYLSKCPESVKTRNDVFYLQPERSCVPDSPVWYSTQPLSQESLQKMLHRVKMVKEINIALLTS